MRSLLFVPADSDRKLAKSLGTGADVLIFDLEDAVSMARKEAGREELARFLASDEVLSQRGQAGTPRLYVRVNALDTGMTLEDLVAVMALRPDGIVLPKCRHASDVNTLANYLDALEAQHPQPGREPARIIAIATETAEAIEGLSSYGEASERLEGLMWGAEDLSGDVGALTNKGPDGQWTSLFDYARTRCLMGASAAGVIAIDTVPTDIHNLDALRSETEHAYRDGFSAKAAIHPGQVPVINAAMTPDAETIEWANRVVAAFEASSTVGVATLDGMMLDTPHLRLARKILAAAALSGPTANCP